MSGWVYIFEAPKLHCIKIGYSGSYPGVEARLRATQTHMPADVALLAIFPGSVKSERWLHRKMAKLRIRGEWFVRTPEVVKAAKLYNALGATPSALEWKQIFKAIKVGAKRWQPNRWIRRFKQTEKELCRVTNHQK